MFLIDTPSQSQISRFHRDGFLIVERLIEPEAAARLAARFAPNFRGEFENRPLPRRMELARGT